MKRKTKGSVTVEAAFLVPIIFMVIAVVISILFYYHDKNVIAGVAHETVTVCSRSEMTEAEIESYFYEQLGEKLLLFGYVDVELEEMDKELCLNCTARKNGMNLNIVANMKRTSPESQIRTMRLLQRLENLVGESE